MRLTTWKLGSFGCLCIYGVTLYSVIAAILVAINYWTGRHNTGNLHISFSRTA